MVIYFKDKPTASENRPKPGHGKPWISLKVYGKPSGLFFYNYNSLESLQKTARQLVYEKQYMQSAKPVFCLGKACPEGG